MADELKITTAATLVKSNLKRTIQSETKSITVSGSTCWGPVTVTVGTSEEDLAPVDVATAGWMILKNLDTTNFVKYGPKSGTMVEFARLKAGETHMFRFAPTVVVLRWIADTAPVNVDVMLVSD